MHNELKITDMQTLESNKKTIEQSANPISLELPDFTTDSYKDAYSRINAIVIEGEQEAHDNYISIATLIPNEGYKLKIPEGWSLEGNAPTARLTDDLSKSGVIGDSRGANESLGKNLKELLINHWFKLIMNLMQSDWPNNF